MVSHVTGLSRPQKRVRGPGTTGAVEASSSGTVKPPAPSLRAPDVVRLPHRKRSSLCVLWTRKSPAIQGTIFACLEIPNCHKEITGTTSWQNSLGLTGESLIHILPMVRSLRFSIPLTR